MNLSLASLLSKQNPPREQVYNAIVSGGMNRVKLVMKAKERLIDLIYTDKEDVTFILHHLAAGKDIIQGLAEVNQKLSVICDRILKDAIQPPTNYNDPEEIEKKAGELTVIDELITASNRLKIQLGSCVHEYIFSSFSKERLHPIIAVKAMKVVLTALTQCPENKIVFSRTNATQINGIFDYITNTADPMGQTYAAECLWRVFSTMRGKRQRSEIEKMFGSFLEQIEAIDINNFCSTIHEFLHHLNSEYRNIYSLNISNLIVGGQFITGEHSIDIGDASIVVWVTPGAQWSKKQEKCDLISLKIDDIIGISNLGEHWAIILDDHFDTLPDCFIANQRKCIFFDPIEDNTDIDHMYALISDKFGKFDSDYLEYPEKSKGKTSKKAKSTKTKAQKQNKIEQEKHSLTPKPKKAAVERDSDALSKTPKVDSKKSSRRIETPQTPSVTKLHTFTSSNKIPKIPLRNDYLLISDSSDILPSFDLHDLSDTEPSSPIQQKPLGKAKSRKFTPDQGKITKSDPKTTNSNKESTKENQNKYINKDNKSKAKFTNENSQKETTIQIPNKNTQKVINQEKPIEIESSDEIPKPDLTSEDDDIPAPSFSQTFESDEDNTVNKETRNDVKENKTLPSFDMSENVQKEESQPITHDDPIMNQDNFSINMQPLPIRPVARAYAPDRWELEAFEELKSFANIVRTKLIERHDEISQVIEDTTSNAIGEINSFMSKCDQDLEKLRLNFKDTSASIASDISAKQRMVQELGEQQREHIDQMQKDCAILQKRADEMVKRFEQQKKQLILNQQKHIALFREDLKTEVKTAVTKRRREYSRNKVQKLVNLLEEL